MPLENTSTVVITCDNHVCDHDHSELSPNDRKGWLFVSSEVYGMPTQQHVYCCSDCAAMDASDAFMPPEVSPPIQVAPAPEPLPPIVDVPPTAEAIA